MCGCCAASNDIRMNDTTARQLPRMSVGMCAIGSTDVNLKLVPPDSKPDSRFECNSELQCDACSRIRMRIGFELRIRAACDDWTLVFCLHMPSGQAVGQSRCMASLVPLSSVLIQFPQCMRSFMHETLLLKTSHAPSCPSNRIAFPRLWIVFTTS